MGVRSPSPTLGLPTQGSSARKTSSHNLWLKIQTGLSWWKKLWCSKQFLLKNPHMGLIRLTPSEILHRGTSLNGTSGIQGGTEVSGIKVEAGGVFSQTARWAEAGVPFLSPWTPTEPENWQASAIKKQWGLSWGKKLLETQAVPLKEPTYGLTYSDSLPLSSSSRLELERHQ